MDKMNPWRIEIERQYPSSDRPIGMTVNIVNDNTGEIRQTMLDVEFLDSIIMCDRDIICRVAELLDKDEDGTYKLIGLKKPINEDF
jgi:hypothetical protein